MSANNILLPESLLATSIPEDWFRRIFDTRYYLVDKKRKSTDLTSHEVSWIERLVTDTLHPLTILDVGCGYGRHTIELSKRGHKVLGIDQSSELLEIARADSQTQGIRPEFIECDFRQLPNALFDIIMLMHTTFGYFSDSSENEKFFLELVSHIRPGGFLLLQQRRPSSLPDRLTIDEKFILQDVNLKYSRFSVYSNESEIWQGAYKYENVDSSNVHVLPYYIHLYQEDVFSRWLSSSASECHVSLHRGYPNSPAEEMYVIQKAFASSSGEEKL